LRALLLEAGLAATACRGAAPVLERVATKSPATQPVRPSASLTLNQVPCLATTVTVAPSSRSVSLSTPVEAPLRTDTRSPLMTRRTGVVAWDATDDLRAAEVDAAAVFTGAAAWRDEGGARFAATRPETQMKSDRIQPWTMVEDVT
jgi:hypothetical protein